MRVNESNDLSFSFLLGQEDAKDLVINLLAMCHWKADRKTRCEAQGGFTSVHIFQPDERVKRLPCTWHGGYSSMA